MHLSQLRAAQPELVRGGATGLDRIRGELADAAERVDRSVRLPLADGAWVGAASKAALTHIDGVQRRLTDAADAVTKAGSGVRQLADALADAKQLVAKADQLAAEQRLKIGDDGSITFPTSSAPVSPADDQAMRAAGTAARDLLGRAVAMAGSADELCARTLSEAGGAGALNTVDAVAATLGTLAGATQSSGEQSGGGFWDTLHDAFVGDGQNFEDSMLGDAVSDWSDGDRSIWERATVDPEGRMDPFDLEPWEEELIAETPLGATPDELLGSEVVDTIHEEGVAAGPRAWWDENWEDFSNVPDRIADVPGQIREGVDDFVDDPIGTVGGLFRD